MTFVGIVLQVQCAQKEQVMSKANTEQLKAIEHSGGVLLNAGAGAGKTFVLVEHIRYLIEEFFKRNSKILTNQILLKNQLNQYLSGIVLMTFTNEAARELKARIFKRFKDDTEYPMSIVMDSLINLNISTIHGFCLKLISEGFVEGAPANLELYDEDKISLKIEKIVVQWISNQPDSEKTQLLLKNISSIFDSMKKIFLTPELRAQWSEASTQSDFDEEKYFADFFKVLGVYDIWGERFALEGYDDNSSTKWYGLLKDLNTIRCLPLKWNNIVKILDAYEKQGRVTAPSKIIEVKLELEKIKVIRDVIKKYKEEFEQFFSFEHVAIEWKNSLDDLFRFIENKYYQSPGISFSDLEYLVRQSLKNNIEIRKNVAKRFSYLIVDEYQDTSSIQYEILKLATLEDFDRIFCVGDRKQAIYGFRGGELSVFNDTSEKINRNLPLLNNYRSQEKVVDFNNKFFEFIFPLGKDYDGEDVNHVVVDAQVFPEGKEPGLGSINRTNINVNSVEVEKLNSDALNLVEAHNICEIIKEKLNQTNQNICVLYRNLNPSQSLIEKLIQEKIAFEAQVKIPLGEDPVFVLFSALIDSFVELKKIKVDLLLPQNEKVLKINHYLSFMTSNVLRHFDLSILTINEEKLLKLYKNISLQGLELIFLNYLNILGISNSMFKDNTMKILELISLNNSRIDSVWEYLRKINGDKYSTKFYFGLNPRVKIMTTHASKGLQFDHVILGGIHSNGRIMVDSDFIGKMPGSFKWTNDLYRKKLYTSPAMILERLIDQQKEFSESKRLFYVACTRAIESINWCDISFNGKNQQTTNGAWVCALRNFDLYPIEDTDKIFEFKNKAQSGTPMYFTDSLGINIGKGRELGLISEVSVTKLSTLAICPKKFYLDQILKIDEQWEKFTKENEIQLPKRIGVSDAKKGIRIHKMIEGIIESKKFDSEKDEDEISSWIKSKLRDYSDKEFIAEKEMKFSIFGQMITGIPDLVINCDEDSFEIWDFKTGIVNQDDLDSYFFQLKCYALGYSQINNLNNKVKCSLKIMALDQSHEIEVKLSVKECIDHLYLVWSKLNDFSTKKINHCSACEYGNLCH